MKRLILLFWLVSVQTVFAEPTEIDQRILKAARANPTAGLIFMEVKFYESGSTTPKICQKIWVTVVSDQGKATLVITQASPTLFGRAAESSTYGGPAVLLEGVYTITSILCEGSTRFPGQFARFALRAGQVLNLGCLVVDYKRGPFNPFSPTRSTGQGQLRVEDLSPLAVASLTQRAPVAFSKAVKRYMTAAQAKKPQP
jgi:hypothetical protein